MPKLGAEEIGQWGGQGGKRGAPGPAGLGLLQVGDPDLRLGLSGLIFGWLSPSCAPLGAEPLLRASEQLKTRGFISVCCLEPWTCLTLPQLSPFCFAVMVPGVPSSCFGVPVPRMGTEARCWGQILRDVPRAALWGSPTGSSAAPAGMRPAPSGEPEVFGASWPLGPSP